MIDEWTRHVDDSIVYLAHQLLEQREDVPEAAATAQLPTPPS